MERTIEGAVAVVTGASRGIGRALSLALAEAGAKVWGGARSASELAQLADHPLIETHPLDVTDAESVVAFVNAVLDEEESINILVNNAGVLGPKAPLTTIDFRQWEHVIDVNLHGVFRVTHPFLGRITRGGIIVNVSSSVGRVGRGEWGPYAVSKHGVEGLTGTLSDELEASGVTVVSVNPGGTATEMRAEAYPDEDPDSIPSAETVAEVFRQIIVETPLDRTGAKLNARDFL